MDDPAVDPAELDHAMRHLEFINRTLNGYGPSLRGIEALLPSGATGFSLLDVGCGSGDTLRQIAQWARKRRLDARLHGVELSAQSADRAAELCREFPEITVAHADLMEMPTEHQFDITHCALVLHHISDDNAAADFLRQMGRLARMGVVVNDLHRHPLAWHSIRLLTRTFSRSRVLQNDAPLSVARSFTRAELKQIAREAALDRVEIQWQWAFRWLLTARTQPQA